MTVHCAHIHPLVRLVVVQWKTNSYSLVLPADTTMGFLKMQIAIHTNVKPAHQKLIHKAIKPKHDDTLPLHSLFTTNDRLMLIGNPEADLLHSTTADDMSDVIDDLDDTATSMSDSELLRADPEHKRKLEKYRASIEITFINPLRPGKRLLVLDLDFTLFDMKTASDDFTRLKRPFTHRFLAALYPHYELIIWSQTSWRWLEMKLTELGMLTHPAYKILFVLDKTCMFRVTPVQPSSASGERRKHHVKALELVWHRLPQFHAGNTVHVDDLARNFALNPQSGLKIRPYKNSTEARHTDRELLYLSVYLALIAEHEKDFRGLRHDEWREYMTRRGQSVEQVDAARGKEVFRGDRRRSQR